MIESPLARFPEAFESVFDRFLTSWPVMETPEWPNRWDVTMEENETEMLVRMEVPGFEPAEVKVELVGDQLTVEAEHREPAEAAAKTETETRSERVRMRRMLALPPGIDREHVEATYRNGILEIHLPREPEAVGRRIEVKA